MRWNYFIVALLIFPHCSTADNYINSKILYSISTPKKDNTIVRSLFNEQDWMAVNNTPIDRTENYPTQVIRLTQKIETPTMTCTQVNEQIDLIFVKKITKDKFSYATFISCTYDPDTHLAIQFIISSYFDPINDEGIAYLKAYLNEYNGINLLGTPFIIEPAHALIISLNLSVGMKKNPVNPPFVLYRQDRSSLYFKNTYEMKKRLLTDVNESFFSDDPSKILPFLDKWLFEHASGLYKAILRDSSFASLEPERIFLMDSGEPLYVSPIKFYYNHNCAMRYEHHHCLKQEL